MAGGLLLKLPFNTIFQYLQASVCMSACLVVIDHEGG
ncbi:hypothetical protein GYH30_055069 [Glycine max]|nr:hypothetical protein GYH30_055069 [Glycine max]